MCNFFIQEAYSFAIHMIDITKIQRPEAYITPSEWVFFLHCVI